MPVVDISITMNYWWVSLNVGRRLLNKPRPLWSLSPSCDYHLRTTCGSSVMDIWWSGVSKMNDFCLYPWQGEKREWINEILCLFFDQRLPTWKVFSAWVQLIAWCWLSSERVRGQEGTIKQRAKLKNIKPAPPLNTILWPNAWRVPELLSPHVCRRKQQTTKPPADFNVKQQQKKSTMPCCCFFFSSCSLFLVYNPN